jgi:hypothetical protein
LKYPKIGVAEKTYSQERATASATRNFEIHAGWAGQAGEAGPTRRIEVSAEDAGLGHGPARTIFCGGAVHTTVAITN